MLRVILLFIGLGLFVNSSLLADEDEQVLLPEYSRIFSAQHDPFKDARSAIALAKQTEKEVFIEVGGNWCEWCEKFDRLIQNNSELSKAFHQRFVLLKVNVSDENGNQPFIDTLPEFSGYPHFFVSDKEGNIYISQSPTDFVSSGQFVPERIMEFIRNE